jgi:hypothetical protein
MQYVCHSRIPIFFFFFFFLYLTLHLVSLQKYNENVTLIRDKNSGHDLKFTTLHALC